MKDSAPAGWVIGSQYGGEWSVSEIEDRVFDDLAEAQSAFKFNKDDLGYSHLRLFALVEVQR